MDPKPAFFTARSFSSSVPASALVFIAKRESGSIEPRIGVRLSVKCADNEQFRDTATVMSRAIIEIACDYRIARTPPQEDRSAGGFAYFHLLCTQSQSAG